MMQEPAGLNPQGQAPKILPGQEALLAEALQPLQDPQGPQGPPPPLVLGGQPRMPSMDLPPMGEDSPPIMGMLDQTMAPPPGLPPMTVPDQLPSDPAAASQLLEAIPIYLKNELQRRDYQQQLDVAKQVNEGPHKAEGIQARMMLEPDDPGIDQEIEDSAPYLPKSTTQKLKSSRSRGKVLKGVMESFDKELETKLRSTFSESVVRKGEENRQADLRGKIADLDQKIGKIMGPNSSALGTGKVGMEVAFEHPELVPMMQEKSRLEGEMSSLTSGRLEMSDLKRGVTGMFAGEGSVEESMLGTAKRLISQRVEQVSGMSAPKIVGELAAGRMPSVGKTMDLPEGVTPDMYRSALAEQAARTIGRIKGVTTGKDVTSAAVGVLPWALAGGAEIGLFGKAAGALLNGSRLMKAAPKVAEAAKVAITYVAGPALAEGSIAAVLPLSASAQNQVDQIEDPKLRESTESAYRVLQVTQAATLASLFSMSDVLRLAGGSGSLGKMAQRYVEKGSLGKTIGSTLAMAAAAPSMTEIANMGVEKAAEMTRSGDVTPSDVLADMAAARNPALVGPARRLLQAGSWDERLEAAKEYALAAAPMAIGIGTIHALSFAGAKMTSRKQMLELNRGAEKDVQAMVDKGDLDPEVGKVVMQKLREETEQMAPSKADDKRRATQEVVTEALGKEGGEARVMAEKTAGDLLPHLEGESVRQKLADAVEKHDADPDNPERQRDLEVAMRLEDAAAAADREEAALAIASARRRATEDPGTRDLGDDALSEMIHHDEARTMAPETVDPTMERLAGEAQREWEMVHLDEDTGDFTLRSMDGENERIVVPERDLMHYRVADEGVTVEGIHGTTDEMLAVRNTAQSEGAEPLPSVSREGDAGVAQDASAAGRSKASRRSEELREGLPGQGQDPTRAVRGVRSEGGDAPQGLRQATPGDMAVPEASPGGARQARIRDDLNEAATQLVDLGVLSQRKLAEKLGVSQRRAASIFRDLEADGVVQREGKAWVIHPERSSVKPDGSISMSQARHMDLERLGKEAEGLVDEIGTEFLSKGTTLRATDKADRLGRLIVDFGDIARPDDPEAGSAAIAAQLLRQLPEELRTDETITKVMGFPKEAVEMVRAAMEDPAVREASQAGLGDAVRPGLPGVEPSVDTRLAAKQPVLDALMEPVREVWESAMGKRAGSEAEGVARAEEYFKRDQGDPGLLGMKIPDVEKAIPDLKDALRYPSGPARSQALFDFQMKHGVSVTSIDDLKEQVAFASRYRELAAGKGMASEAAAAEAAYAAWSKHDLNLTVKTHKEFVAGETKEVDSILKRLVKGKGKDEALSHLGERIRDLELQSEATSLLSLTPEGRKVIQRLNDLRDAIFVGGAIPDRLLASLETGATPKLPPNRESGSAYVPNFLGAGYQMLVSGAKRAVLWLQIGRRTMASLYHAFASKLRAGRAAMGRNWMVGGLVGAAGGYKLGGTGGAVLGGVFGTGAVPKAWRVLKSWRGKEHRQAVDLRHLNDWTETVAPDLHGELLGGRDRGAKPTSFIADDLSKWRESESAFMIERATKSRAVAEEMANRTYEHVKPDSRESAMVTRYLEAATPEERASIAKELSPEAKTIADTYADMYRSTRALVARHALPDQIIREKEYLPHLRTVHKRLETAREALREPLQEALAARDKLPRPKKDEVPTPEWKEAERKVRQLRRAIKKFDEKIAEAAKHVVTIHGELDQIAKDWGIENYSPHVINRDIGTPIHKLDFAEALASLHAHEGDLLEMARDHVPQMVPQRLRSKHWKKRKSSGEKINRDVDFVRSGFHYFRELYRLLPASAWYEANRERLFGKQRVLENAEIDMGSVSRMDAADTGYKSRRVRWVDFARGNSVRADQHFQLGGKVHTLTWASPDGVSKRDVHFRTYGDLERARAMGPESFNLPKDWTVAEDQKFGHRILLLPDRATEASPDQRIRTAETEVRDQRESSALDEDGSLTDADDMDVDEVTKQLHLPTWAQTMWPSEVYGRLSTTEPGKYQRILQQSGEKSAAAFAEHIHHILDTAVGHDIRDLAKNIASTIANVTRHGVLGLNHPGSALREMIDTTAMNSFRLGVDNAWEAASWSMEFSKRLHEGINALDKAGIETWLKEHQIRAMDDGSLGSLPPSLLEKVKTPQAKLDVMPADKREKAMLQDEAFQEYLKSSLSGGSVMAMFTPVERRYSYGKDIRGSRWSRIKRGADKFSWWLRGRAQEHTMQATYLCSYMVARRGGLSRDAAAKQAGLYALSASVVSNRSLMAPVMNTAPGILGRPIMSWMIAQSSINWRYLFHTSPEKQTMAKAGLLGPEGSWGKVGRVGGAIATRAVTRIASSLAGMYAVQQLASLFGYDITRSLGQGLGDVPFVGKWGVMKLHEIEAKMHLAATPDDAYQELPEWRQKLVDQAKEHAPEWMREWTIRMAQYGGSMPADVPIFPMYGNWIPYAAERAKDWADLFKAEMIGDVKEARRLWYKSVVGGLWMFRVHDQIVGSESDPADENFALMRNPATGVTFQRREKGEMLRVMYNLMGSSVEDSVDRIRRTVLQPLATEREVAATKSAAFLAGDLHQKATRAMIQANNTQDPGAKAKLEQMAHDYTSQFRTATIDYARSHEMTRNETKALMKRWSRVAEQNYLLTSSERDIVNAYSSDMAFRLMANELNKVPLVDKPAMSEKRWGVVQSLWFSDADAMRQSLKGVSSDTREKFLHAFRTARQRWAMQAEAEKAGVR